jgi:hypothetical protein
MRFISIYTHKSRNRPPTEAEIATMTKLVEDGMKAGWLIATEGVSFGEAGVRLHKEAGSDVIVTDGPFAEAKEVIGGFGIFQVRDHAEAVEWAQRFAALFDNVEVEVRVVSEYE